MAVSSYLPKSNRDMGIAFGVHFRHDFWTKTFLITYLMLYQWEKFQCYTFFPSQDIKQNVLLSS